MATFVLLLISMISTSLAQVEQGCVITETSCPCAIRSSSGMCMRHQGGNQCLMGECSEGYKCDCLGFELCSIASCAKYTTLENAIPSEENLFQCHMTPDAGTCIDFESFQDTIVATDSATRESSEAVKSVTEYSKEATADLGEIQEDKIKIDDAIRELNTFPLDVSEEEWADMQQDSIQALDDLNEAAGEVAELHDTVVEATRADIEAAKHRRNAYKREREAKKLDKELEEEEKKQDNEAKRKRCDALKDKIKTVRQARKQAAIEAGTWVKKCRAAKKRGNKCRRKVEKSKLSAGEARKKCIDKAKKILRRLRGQLL